MAIFGLGLIGRSIVTSAKELMNFRATQFAFSWDTPDRRVQETAVIEQCMLKGTPETAKEHLPILERVDVIWAAGRAGFGSPAHETELELGAYGDVLALGERLRQRTPDARHVFHLISSAGGLFEGQRQVQHASVPCPKRAYGTLKLEQERRLACSHVPVEKLIYRPSSVYGYSGNGVRIGLVNALIQNAIRHRVSRIIGEPHTIRDYVLASDVGAFVARRLIKPSFGSDTFLLANGKPSSMFEMLHKIELVIGRKLYLQFDAQPFNTSHMSFCQSALPSEWRPTDLETGIRQTALRLAGSFLYPK